MKVKALCTDMWYKRDVDGNKLATNSGYIKHEKNEIYEVTSKCTIGSITPAYTIKIGNEYGAIDVNHCKIVEGSLDDLNNNIVEHKIDLVL